ncbi:hypothetical protein ACFXTO_012314 [Malus domestica]
MGTSQLTRTTQELMNITWDARHRATSTKEQHNHLVHDIGSVVHHHCPMQWEFWRLVPQETKDAVLHELSKFNDPAVAIAHGCPLELVKCSENWAWLCTHFQDEKYLKRAKANTINRSKKKLIHHSGFRRFSYRMEERRRADGVKVPKIDTFNEVYVRPGDELTNEIHATMVEMNQVVLEEVASQLPPDTTMEKLPPSSRMRVAAQNQYIMMQTTLIATQHAHIAAQESRMAQIITAFMRGGFDIPATTPHTTTPSTSQALDPAQPTAEANSDDFLF